MLMYCSMYWYSLHKPNEISYLLSMRSFNGNTQTQKILNGYWYKNKPVFNFVPFKWTLLT